MPSKYIKCLYLLSCLLFVGCILKLNLDGFFLKIHITGNINKPITIGLNNLSVVDIDPNGEKISIDWKAYNKKLDNTTEEIFEEITLVNEDEVYKISSQTNDVNAILINKQNYQFDPDKKHLQIKFGKGVSLEDGSDHLHAVKLDSIGHYIDNIVYLKKT